MSDVNDLNPQQQQPPDEGSAPAQPPAQPDPELLLRLAASIQQMVSVEVAQRAQAERGFIEQLVRANQQMGEALSWLVERQARADGSLPAPVQLEQLPFRPAQAASKPEAEQPRLPAPPEPPAPFPLTNVQEAPLPLPPQGEESGLELWAPPTEQPADEPEFVKLEEPPVERDWQPRDIGLTEITEENLVIEETSAPSTEAHEWQPTETVAASTSPAEAPFLAAESFRQQEEWEQAILQYSVAIALDAGYRPAYMNRGLAYRARREHDRALADFDTAIQLDPHDAEAYLRRGNINSDRGSLEQAIADYSNAVQVDAGFATAYLNRALALARLNRFEEVLEDVDRALEADPQLHNVYFIRGTALTALERHEDAIAAFDKLLSLDPKNALAYNERGLVHAKRRDYDRAIQDYARALKLNPKLVLAQFNRGVAYRLKGGHDLAIAELTQVLTVKPKLARGYFQRGLAYMASGEPEAALADFENTLAHDPGFPHARTQRDQAARACRKRASVTQLSIEVPEQPARDSTPSAAAKPAAAAPPRRPRMLTRLNPNGPVAGNSGASSAAAATLSALGQAAVAAAETEAEPKPSWPQPQVPEPAKKPAPTKKPRRRYDDDDDEGASRRKWLAGLAALLVLGVVGYGMSGGEEEGRKPVYRVEGKVLVQGQPIGNALVALHSKDGYEEKPVATTAEDGSFKLTTYRKEDGAPVGKYVVTVTYSPPIVNKDGDATQGPNLLPKQFESPKTSDLFVEIVKGDNTLAPIELSP